MTKVRGRWIRRLVVAATLVVAGLAGSGAQASHTCVGVRINGSPTPVCSPVPSPFTQPFSNQNCVGAGVNEVCVWQNLHTP